MQGLNYERLTHSPEWAALMRYVLELLVDAQDDLVRAGSKGLVPDSAYAASRINTLREIAEMPQYAMPREKDDA